MASVAISTIDSQIEQLNIQRASEGDIVLNSSDTETKINFNNINALPKLHFEKNINENEIEDDFEEFIVNTSDETENDIDKDIDKDSLEMVVIGNKKYLMDYNKGFIYDTKFNIVGNIDEFGNPNIN